ncbi:MAG: type VII toxin-antitoxin system HepT family RNase toxin [Thermodesulfobacteriota bacterium]
MVDLILVERILADIQANINSLKAADDITWDVYRQDIRNRRFVERTLHIIIEGIIDVGQHIIADEGMREPESYRDLFLVLAENGVISRDNLPTYEKMAMFRNLIVHYYEKVDDELMFGIFRKNLPDALLFIAEIRSYLNSIRQF